MDLTHRIAERLAPTPSPVFTNTQPRPERAEFARKSASSSMQSLIDENAISIRNWPTKPQKLGIINYYEFVGDALLFLLPVAFLSTHIINRILRLHDTN
jgi:hypothetical protein